MRIIDCIRPDKQTVMFSATFPRQMESLARKILDKPVEVVNEKGLTYPYKMNLFLRVFISLLVIQSLETQMSQNRQDKVERLCFCIVYGVNEIRCNLYLVFHLGQYFCLFKWVSVFCSRYKLVVAALFVQMYSKMWYIHCVEP